jgi:glycerol-3-phosphate cytidylyltransferase
MIIGYTTGVYDLFHIGHLNILNKSKKMCDKLIVGVTTDELMMTYKNKKSVIPFEERSEIVSNIKCVDVVVPQDSMNKIDAWKKLKFNIMFVGDDWHDTPKWNIIEEELKKQDVKIVYFPYTKGTSSTIINDTLAKIRESL